MILKWLAGICAIIMMAKICARVAARFMSGKRELMWFGFVEDLVTTVLAWIVFLYVTQ